MDEKRFPIARGKSGQLAGDRVCLLREEDREIGVDHVAQGVIKLGAIARD